MADIKIYGKLINATTEGKIVGANQTYDDTQEKFQSQINAEIKGQLGNSQSGLLKKVNDIEESLNSHRETTTGNPHNVTKSDVGLSNVDNTSDADKPVSTAQEQALDGKVDKVPGKSLVLDTEIAKLSELQPQTQIDISIADAKKAGTDAQANLDIHTSNEKNPHNVTKEQVGLDRVNNTTDLEKPISTATQNALDTKANKSDLNDKVSSTTIANIIPLTSKQYIQLTNKDSSTLYLIVDSVIALEDGALIIQE